MKSSHNIAATALKADDHITWPVKLAGNVVDPIREAGDGEPGDVLVNHDRLGEIRLRAGVQLVVSRG